MDLAQALDRLSQAQSDDERLAVLDELAPTLDFHKEAYKYELAATEIAMKFPEMLDPARGEVLTGGRQDPTRFLCFAAAAIGCRRLHMHGRGRELMQRVQSEYSEVALFKHFNALSFTGGTRAELQQGVDAARSALRDLPDSPGAHNSVSSAIIELAECDGEADPGFLQDALKEVNEAIERSRRPRFLFTRARVYRKLKRYDDARDDLVEAIDREERGTGDYRERIFDYSTELALLDVERSAEQLVATTEKSLQSKVETTVKEAVDGAQLRLVQTIAFVAAAIGLIQASVGTLANRTIGQALAILTILAITLFGAVGIASYFISPRRKPRQEKQP